MLKASTLGWLMEQFMPLQTLWQGNSANSQLSTQCTVLRAFESYRYRSVPETDTTQQPGWWPTDRCQCQWSRESRDFRIMWSPVTRHGRLTQIQANQATQPFQNGYDRESCLPKTSTTPKPLAHQNFFRSSRLIYRYMLAWASAVLQARKKEKKSKAGVPLSKKLPISGNWKALKSSKSGKLSSALD